ncbi:hypothetical protein BH10PSE7_BH10PSE7_36630 [soil metagenome]
MATLTVSGSFRDYRGQMLSDIDRIEFVGNSKGIFGGEQFQDSPDTLISESVTIDGSGGFNAVRVRGDGTFDAGGWSFVNWGPEDLVQLFAVAGGSSQNDLMAECIQSDGGPGNDTLLATYREEATLFGGAGDDQLTGNIDRDILDGGLGDDIVFGGAGRDSLGGGEGDDRLEGGEGSDTLSGGAGNDTLLSEGSDAKEMLDGGSGNDFLASGFRNDNISGGTGNDTIDASWGGIDTIDGGAGIDSLRIHFGSGGVDLDIRDGGGGRDAGRGRIIAGIEQITVVGGWGYDHIIGGALSDDINGGGGRDQISGGGGDDTLRIDLNQSAIVYGGSGSDALFISYDKPKNLSIDITAGGAGHNIGNGTRIFGVESLNFEGGSGNDRFIGGALSDQFRSLAGADTILSGGGDDYLQFSSNDVIDGGTGVDALEARFETTKVDLSVDISDGGGGRFIGNGTKLSHVEILQDYAGGSARDDVIGGAFADRIAGNAGSDFLRGGGGNDTLAGGAGHDALSGGAGADHFQYLHQAESSAGQGHDVVRDFNTADGDSLDLSGVDGIDHQEGSAFHLTTDGGAGVFTAQGTASAGELRFFQSAGKTLVQGDVNGDGKADLVIELTGLIPLTGDNFIL